MGAVINILNNETYGRSEKRSTFFLNLYIQWKTTKLGLPIEVLQLDDYCALDHFCTNLQPPQCSVSAHCCPAVYPKTNK